MLKTIVLGLVALISVSSTRIIPAKEILITPPASVSVWEGYAKLKRICAVESSGDPNKDPRQYDDDGVTPLWGWDKDPAHPGKYIQVKRDVGMCQINTEKWLATAERMDLDVVNSVDDNIVFAKWLYDRYGWHPWIASRDNWN